MNNIFGLQRESPRLPLSKGEQRRRVGVALQSMPKLGYYLECAFSVCRLKDVIMPAQLALQTKSAFESGYAVDVSAPVTGPRLQSRSCPSLAALSFDDATRKQFARNIDCATVMQPSSDSYTSRLTLGMMTHYVNI
jgi:hypothetical protein